MRKFHADSQLDPHAIENDHTHLFSYFDRLLYFTHKSYCFFFLELIIWKTNSNPTTIKRNSYMFKKQMFYVSTHANFLILHVFNEQ